MSSPIPSSIPPAFLCTISKQVMDNPVLGLCGHLFERTVADNASICPLDNSSLTAEGSLVFLSELKKTIQVWKKNLPSSQATKPIKRTNKEKEILPPFEEKKEPPRRKNSPFLFCISNAHQDDIHGLIPFSETSFISGSKDTTLKVWEGKRPRYSLVREGDKGYKRWITALTRFSDKRWAAGTRDGQITIWSGINPITQLEYSPSSSPYYRCKNRNRFRINCITEHPSSGKELLFYTGSPSFFHLWSANKKKIIQSYQADKNDWVYCIDILEKQKLLLAIGSRLEVWDLSQHPNPEKTVLLKETNSNKTPHQREHISSITRLEGEPSFLAAAIFNGSVKVIDLSTQKVVKDYQEHQGRVWSVVNIASPIFASCADDSTIKIWDTRQAKASLSIRDTGGGRVSCLLRMPENLLISGACPDQVMTAKSKARLCFWDLRQIV